MKKNKTKKTAKIAANPITKEERSLSVIASYFSISRLVFLAIVLFVFGFLLGISTIRADFKSAEKDSNYWFLLHRKSNKEFLYKGRFGDIKESELVREFGVKGGVSNEKPTPLPSLVGRKYWLITDKFDARDYDETAPYFLKLDVPVTDEEPFGPEPYLECGGQCNWSVPGFFGLHGINGDTGRLSGENSGSSGCIRHKDEDITYLYNLLDPKSEEIRYYIIDN